MAARAAFAGPGDACSRPNGAGAPPVRAPLEARLEAVEAVDRGFGSLQTVTPLSLRFPQRSVRPLTFHGVSEFGFQGV